MQRRTMVLEGGESSGMHHFWTTRHVLQHTDSAWVHLYLGVLKAFVIHISCIVALRAIRNRHHKDRNGSVFSFFVHQFFTKQR